MNRVRTIFSAVFVLISFTTSQGFSWGKGGHTLITEAAARLLPPSPLTTLIQKNPGGMNYLSMVPDTLWKHGPTPHPLEAHSHFFNIDFYGPANQQALRNFSTVLNKVGREKVLHEGSVPYRAAQLANLLLEKMKSPTTSPNEILIIAGTMAHYYGDAGNPLHVVTDYDGKNVGAPGLHSFFESKTVDEFNRTDLMNSVLAEAQNILPKIRNNIDPLEAALLLNQAAHDQSGALLAAAQKYKLTEPLKSEMRPIIIRTLALSTAALAKVWYAQWIGAGQPNIQSIEMGRVPPPEWIPLDYLK